MPPRQAHEEVTVRVGALLGGTLTYLLAIGATEGLHRLQDRKHLIASGVGQRMKRLRHGVLSSRAS